MHQDSYPNAHANEVIYDSDQNLYATNMMHISTNNDKANNDNTMIITI